MKDLQCYYKNISCSGLDTSGMTKIGCENCEHYGDGVRLTGSIPNLGLKKLWDKWHLYILWFIAGILFIIT